MALKTKATKVNKYYEAVGRRKTAVARIRLWLNDDKQEIIVNNKNYSDYFPGKELQDVLLEPIAKSGIKTYKISIKVFGGGLRAQAYASRHGLSRALILAHPESKTILKTLGFLTRDPRMKERKKPGLKGARRAPQWSKR
ncbi:MAG: 30S ribosomal protein S9 [bacterium]|nr:30S ribosomal protein S9 [bacterium]